MANPLLFPIVKLLAFTASDASVIYNSDMDQRLSDLRHNPASSYYEKLPVKKVLGDLGELTVLKMLIDPSSKDQLSEQEIENIQVKPLLPSGLTDNLQNPDFYLPSRRLVIDAKAWKQLGRGNLNNVIERYVNLECLNDGGEVRLYFPSDTYHQYQSLIDTLPKQVGKVSVRFVPMDKTYKDLISVRELIFTYLKSLILPASPNL